MAKKSIINLTEDFFDFDISDVDPIIIAATRSEINFFDFQTAMEYTITGSGLRVSNGLVVGGRIDTFEIHGVGGEDVLSASRLNINAGILTGETLEDQAYSLYTVIMLNDNDIRGTDDGESINGSLGNDIIRGNGGNDTLYGDRGRDILIGGEGSDFFVHTTGMGRDIIRDFDIDDSDGDRDDVSFSGETEIFKSGKDTIVDYGNGDIFVLKGVNFADFTDAFLV